MDTPALATDTKQRRADRSVYRVPANDVKILVWITPMQQQDYSAFLVPYRRSHTVFAALAFAIPAQEGSELIQVEKQPRSTRYPVFGTVRERRRALIQGAEGVQQGSTSQTTHNRSMSRLTRNEK